MSTRDLTSSQRTGSAILSRAEASRGSCRRSAAPARARDRDRSRRPARPGRPAATVLVLGLLLLGAAAAEAQTTRTLVSNAAQTGDDSASTSGNDHAQLFHTGAHAAGYTLTTVIVNSDDVEDDDFDLDICTADTTANEFPTSTCTALDAPMSFVGVGNVVFTGNLLLSANTNYVVVIKQRGTGSVEIDSTTSGGEDASGFSDWSIKDKFYWKSGSTWMIKSGSNEALSIVVRGYEQVAMDTTDATLSPAFDAATTSYRATAVANSVSQVTMTVTRTEPASTISYLDHNNATLTDASAASGFQVNVGLGTTTVKVEVTSSDLSDTVTYTVRILRLAATATCSPVSMTNRIWTGQMTAGFGQVVGFVEGDTGQGYLDNKTFTYNGTSYTVATLTTVTFVGTRRVIFGLTSNNFGSDATDLMLHMGSNTVAFADATLESDGITYSWQGSSLPSFNNGDGVCLALTVDGPAVSSVALTSTPGSDNTYAIGDAVEATVTFDEAVDIAGSPQLELDFDGTAKAAACTAATNTTTMACSYTVAVGDSAPNGIAIAANKLTLNGGTIRATGSTTIDADLDHVAVAIDAGHKVTQVILTFSEDLGFVDALGIETGGVGAVQSARFSGRTVTATLYSSLTIAAGDTVDVRLVINAVKDAAGNGSLALLAATTVINAVPAPTVSGVALTSAPGTDNTYAIGDSVAATVTFDAAVDITGSPQLELDFAGTAKAAACTAATNTTTMACSYTVAVGDSAPNGIAIAANKLTGGTIYATGSTTANADLDHAAVPIDAGHKVDGIRPTLVTTGSEAPTTSTDGTKVILTFSEDIGSVDRTKITIGIGEGNVASTSAANIVNGTTVELDLSTVIDATVMLTVALAADAVADAAANGNLALAATGVTNAVGSTTAPTVTGIALTSSPQSQFGFYRRNEDVEATVTFDAAVDITGTPQLELDFDGTAKAAACAAATNTTTMVCSYRVATGDSAPNGIAIAANKLTGGTITATGSTTAADLDHDAVTIAAGHKVDGIRPTLVTTGTDAPTTSADGTKVILTFSEDIGGVSRNDITIQANSVTAATSAASVAGPRVELTLTTALTATATNLTVALAAGILLAHGHARGAREHGGEHEHRHGAAGGDGCGQRPADLHPGGRRRGIVRLRPGDPAALDGVRRHLRPRDRVELCRDAEGRGRQRRQRHPRGDHHAHQRHRAAGPA